MSASLVHIFHNSPAITPPQTPDSWMTTDMCMSWSGRTTFGVQLFRNAERIVASLSGMGTGAVLDFDFGVWSLPYHAERLTKIWRLVKSRSSTDKPRAPGLNPVIAATEKIVFHGSSANARIASTSAGKKNLPGFDGLSFGITKSASLFSSRPRGRCLRLPELWVLLDPVLFDVTLLRTECKKVCCGLLYG